MKKEKISKVRVEVELEVPTRQLKELSKEFDRETVEQFLQLWVPERRTTRLVVEIMTDERDNENQRGNRSGDPSSPIEDPTSPERS